MLQRLRESLALVLLAALPFHALFVTVMTKVIAGPDHAPLGILAIWKEAVLGVIVLLAIIELARLLQTTNYKLPTDAVDYLILGLFFLSIIVLIAYRSQLATYVYGFKYDFLAPLAFLILRRVPWSENFFRRALWIVVGAGSLIALYGIVTLFLPDAFFRALGYSDLHSLYIPGGPLAPFQQLGGSAVRRVQSVMSGPNQLGMWLLLPWAVVLYRCLRSIANWRIADWRLWKRLSIFVVLSIALFLTFSRAAWIAAGVIGVIALWITVPKAIRKVTFGMFGSFILILGIAGTALFPQLILRTVSNRGHIERPLEAIRLIIVHPFGQGLGTAGPASNRLSDACVDLPAGSDASWAEPHKELCVFVGGTKVQPLDRECTCPVLPENWYLQIGVELGVVGMVLWILLTVLMIRKLWHNCELRIGELGFGIFGAFLGVSLAGLFLHSWEDSAVAMTVWVMAASFSPAIHHRSSRDRGAPKRKDRE